MEEIGKAVTDNDTALKDAEPMKPFPVWNVFFEDLSGNRSGEASGDGAFAYDLEITPPPQ